MKSRLRPNPIGQLTEDQRAETGARDIECRRDADLGRVDLDAASALGEPGRDVADHRDFETIQEPCAAETDDYAPVEA